MNKETFTLDHLMSLQRVAGRVPMHLSPDGCYLSVSVNQPLRNSQPVTDGFTANSVCSEHVGNRVLVVNTDNGEAIEPFPSDMASWAGVWSPDNRKLVAYVEGESGACLTIWDVETRSIKPLPAAQVRLWLGMDVPQWTPDSQHVVCKLRPLTGGEATDVDTPGCPNRPITVFSSGPAAPLASLEPATEDLMDLGLVSIEDGRVLRLIRNWDFRMWRLAPDGNSVAVLRRVELVEEQSQNFFDLSVIPLDGSAPQTIATRIAQGFGVGFNWSPDNRYIAFTTDYANNNMDEPSRLFAVPADGSREPLDLTPQEGIRVRDLDTPRWSPDSRFVYSLYGSSVWELAPDGSSRRAITGKEIDPDTTLSSWVQDPLSPALWTIKTSGGQGNQDESLLAITYNKSNKRWGLAHMSLGTASEHAGHTQALLTWEYITTDSGLAMTAAADGSACYLVREASDRAPEIWRVTPNGQGDMCHAARLLALNPELDTLALGTSQLVQYRVADGTLEHGVLVLPAAYEQGRQVPLVVHVYGGSYTTSALHYFGVEDGGGYAHAQLLAGQGYAVLYPNMPMTARDPMRQVPGLVLPAIDRVIEMGIADPERIGVMGHSYGGYCTLALLTQTSRFGAALSHCGGGFNMTSEYGSLNEEGIGNTGWCEGDQARLNGTLWEKRDAYIENSPLFYLDRVTTPLLLIVGTSDKVNTAQSGEVFSGLRRLGRQAELRLYHGEDHFYNSWSESNARDVCKSMIAWFNQFLKP